jgi:hypothetical protein
LPDVVDLDGHPISKPGCAGFGVDRVKALGHVIEGVDVEPATGEVERVASLARAEAATAASLGSSPYISGWAARVADQCCRCSSAGVTTSV